MICEYCGEKTATSFCMLEINGNKIERYLCNDCRKVVESMQKQDEFYEQANEILNKEDNFCTNCGTTIKDFLQSSCVGCQECYKKFENQIKKSITNYQTGDTHIGKVPERFIKEQKIKNLEDLLNKALNNQDLTQINRLSWQLKELKGGNK